ncbi:hypothetical protein BDZ45DRAFT_342749 [Acephala macrosclerotiorum]|nr:hypothetical protein BDZ45DRAFT_342749 [Acephala macrosclerotiorum]
MDPLSAASAIAPLVVKAFTLSQQVYTTISQITNAPKHIKAISNDLEDFYIILGTLKGYLEDEDLSQGVLHPSTSNSLGSVLENSVKIFTELNGMVLIYRARGGFGDIGKWRSIKYTFMSAEVESMRAHLAAHKLTLNMAISLANYLNLQTVNATASRIEAEISAHMRELEEKLPLMSQQLEDIQLVAYPPGSEHSLADRGLLLQDPGYAIRAYFTNASSIVSSRAPSMQISSLVTTDMNSVTNSSAYKTAQSHIANSQSPLNTIYEDCAQVFVKGFTSKTLPLQVTSSMTVAQVVQELYARDDSAAPSSLAGNYDHLVYLVYAGKILKFERLLSDYAIPNNATIFCQLRVRGTGQNLIVFSDSFPRDIGLEIITDFTPETTILEVKKILHNTAILPHRQRLYKDAWREFADAKTLGDYGYCYGGKIMIDKNFELNRAWKPAPASSAASTKGSSSQTKLGIISKLRKPLGFPYFRKRSQF